MKNKFSKNFRLNLFLRIGMNFTDSLRIGVKTIPRISFNKMVQKFAKPLIFSSASTLYKASDESEGKYLLHFLNLLLFLLQKILDLEIY